jgi:ribosomal protein S3AE
MAKKQIKKKFFPVKNDFLGGDFELYGTSIEDLENRTVKFDLTRVLRGKGLEIKYLIKIEQGEKPHAYTEPTELSVLSHFIRRMMRKGTDYTEDSIKTNCKNAEVTIKPFMITRKRVSRAVLKTIQEKAREWLIEKLKDLDHLELFDEVLKNKLQKELSLFLKKIYPLSLCEIRKLKITKVLKPIEKEKKVEEPKEEVKKDSKENKK